MRYYKRVLTVVFLAVIYIKSVLSDDECISYDDKVGECKLITTCEAIIPLLNDVHRITQQHREFLKNITCGYQGLTPKVCCPLSENFKKCEVPNGVRGECKDIRNCTAVHNLTVIESFAFFTPSCNTSFNICCPTSVTALSGISTLPAASTSQVVHTTPAPISISTSSSVIGTCQATSLPPDPNTGCCGQILLSSRISGGNVTEINQYPWLVLLEYRDIDLGTIDTKCGGSLISGRYVLTAAHCVHEDVTTPPESVRLGEYDTRTNIDCDTRYEIPHCNNGSESILIQKINIHALYVPGSAQDIALVRLNRTVTFSDFVKPICLPSIPSISATFPSNLYVAGWGTTESGFTSPVKKHVMVPYVDLITCHSMYPRLQLGYGRICAGGEIGKDSCKGDSGGPLMRFTGTHYEVLGIVSLGHRNCRSGKPSVYTNVGENLDWLRLHMHE